MKVLIDPQGKKLYWTQGDLHTRYGVIKEKDLASTQPLLKTHTGKEFLAHPATFTDHLKTITRGPAIINQKDIGYILAITGINHTSKVVDAGTGSGKLAAHLAHLTPHVTTYEKNESFYNLAKNNFKKLNLTITQKNKDISEGIDEKNVDIITLDIPNPQDVLEHAHTALKPGGFLVSYLPNIHQAKTLVDHAHHSFHLEHVTELIERHWKLDENKMAPERTGITHTGFLIFLRKL